MKVGKMRTFGGLRKRHHQFLVAGGKLVDAQRFANCINEPLIEEDDDVHVISVIPPEELHLLIGAVDVHFNLLIKMFGLKYVIRLARSVGALRHGYQGMNKRGQMRNQPCYAMLCFEKVKPLSYLNLLT